MSIVPDRDSGSQANLTALLRGRRVVALTGAGCSTRSGIPDYRGDGAARHRSPIQHRDFCESEATRQRYWARSFVGWPRFAEARPNPAHVALADLESAGMLTGVVTQNVDRLHRAAGSRRVVELHGALAEAACLSCGAVEGRARLQERLAALNPGWPGEGDVVSRPDGDAELSDDAVTRFRVGDCLECGRALKPRVVFFGGTVPADVVQAARALVAQAEVLLVVGSSLAVYSGFRFVRQAAESDVPVAVVNRGPTRADELAALRLDDDCATVLPAVVAELAG